MKKISKARIEKLEEMAIDSYSRCRYDYGDGDRQTGEWRKLLASLTHIAGGSEGFLSDAEITALVGSKHTRWGADERGATAHGFLAYLRGCGYLNQAGNRLTKKGQKEIAYLVAGN